jgi:NAD(P)-dependent dehydrogenase (short-subunit alcohol dehydrogenase family)
MRVQIKGSVFFVTGANRGIGRAIVQELVKSGATKVYAAARKPDSLKDIVAASGGRVVPVTLDITNDAQVMAAANSAPDVQVLVNNAGIANYTAIIAAPDLSSVRAEMEVNFFGLLKMTRAFVPLLKNNGGGALVNISSVAGILGIPLFGTYCATKAAVHSLSQSVRGELKAQGTLVVCVYPGPIDTDMAAGMDMAKEPPQNVAKAIIKGLESGTEEVFPDNVSKDFAAKLKSDAKALEKEWSTMLPEPART